MRKRGIFASRAIYGNKAGAVYGIYAPEHQEFKYIGQTVMKAVDRVKEHINAKSGLGMEIRNCLPLSNLWLFLDIPVNGKYDLLNDLENSLISQYNPPLNQSMKNGAPQKLSLAEFNDLASRLAGRIHPLETILKEKRRRRIIDFFSTENIKLTNLGISLISNPSDDEVRNIFRAIKQIDRVLPFIAGDLMAHNQQQFLDVLSQELDPDDIIGHFSHDALRNYGIAMSSWPYEDREYDLGISFYQATASLIKKNRTLAKEIMEQASRQRWSRQRIREEVGKYLPTKQIPGGTIQDKLYEAETTAYENEIRADKAEAKLAQYESTQPAANLTFTDPPTDLPAYVTRAIETLQGYLTDTRDGRQYTVVSLHADGRVMWIP